ncbi:EXS family-domain-containing protein [Pholiota molesta]|nr:EXS family-domain-containing protein [Pholiota molesta]
MSSPEPDEILYHLSFPLPYRALLLVGLGLLGWATNLHGLDALGVDVVAAMDLRTDTNPTQPVIPVHHTASFNHSKAVLLYHAAYRIFFSYSALCFLSWCLFRTVTHGDRTLVDYYGYIPVITSIAVIVMLFWPNDVVLKTEREKFTLAVRRCLFPPSRGPIYFSDVILADIGTSFAKVFGEVWLSLWMLKPGNSILIPPVEDSWLRWVFPTVMSVPFFLRFRQCLIEYNLPANDSRRPLFNALKYATSFPVIYLSAAQRVVVTDLMKEQGVKGAGGAWQGEHPLFRLWLLAAIVNSLYSFWWDVTNDWGLDLMRFEAPQSQRQPPKPLVLPRLYSGTPLINRVSIDSSSSEEGHTIVHLHDAPKFHPRRSCVGLRPILLYSRAVYPVLIFVNLLLRMTWSIKLSTHVDAMRDGSVGFFWLEVGEIVRRWLWVFLRVEWEVIKNTRDKAPTSNGSTADMLEYEMIPANP